MLDPELSRQRQQRLLKSMAEMQLDAAVIGWAPHVHYFSAFLTGWLHQSAIVLFADGRSWLATANSPAKDVAADEVVAYPAQWNSTQRQEQPQVVSELIIDALSSRRASRVGIDASLVTSQLAIERELEFVAIDPILWQMRRVKDADELSLMKRAIRCCEAMYAHARQIIEPGIPELRVFGELHTVAVATAGEPMTALLGNDYQCGSMGGPARRDRVARDGELYILDLGPTYRGYFSDNARTFAVNRRPTDAQQKAFEAVVGAHEIVQSLARPGVRCRDIWDAVDEHFKSQRGAGLPHHLGHGVGLQPHEFPHLNPKWDDVLMEGEIFTAEPGAYGPELAGGLRLENQYLVTPRGVQNLVDFPLAMA